MIMTKLNPTMQRIGISETSKFIEDVAAELVGGYSTPESMAEKLVKDALEQGDISSDMSDKQAAKVVYSINKLSIKWTKIELTKTK